MLHDLYQIELVGTDNYSKDYYTTHGIIAVKSCLPLGEAITEINNILFSVDTHGTYIVGDLTFCLNYIAVKLLQSASLGLDVDVKILSVIETYTGV